MRPVFLSTGFAMVVALAGLITVSGGAAAERLTAEACDALKAQQDELAPARSDMQQGPEWARTHLPAAKLARIRSLIEVEEQIAFRCRHPRVATAPAPAHDGRDASAASATGEAATAPEAGQPQPRKKKHRRSKSAKPKADAKTHAKSDNRTAAAKDAGKDAAAIEPQ